MQKNEEKLNKLLSEVFNDILKIEQNTLKNGVLKDISITEIHTIEAIGMYTSRTMSEVAADLKITVGTLTTAINKLTKKGYVERERIEEDRRVVMIKLTKKGKVAYRIHEKFHREMTRATIENLNEKESEQLILLLENLNRFFKEKYDLANNKEK